MAEPSKALSTVPWPSSVVRVRCSQMLPEQCGPLPPVDLTVHICLFLCIACTSPFCGCCCSVAKPCLTLCDPMDRGMPYYSVLHYPLEFAQIHVRLTLCPYLLILPSVFPSIRVFSNELALCIRWLKYWSTSFSNSPSSELSSVDFL